LARYILRKFGMKILQICSPHLSDVASLPWEIQKSHFQQCYSYVLLIIYVISEENKLQSIHLPTPPENVTTLPCELIAKLFHLTEGLLRSFKVGGSELKRASLGCRRWL